jgi:hypothetical protein
MKLKITPEILDYIKSGKMDWLIISEKYELDTKFILAHKDKVVWGYILCCQKLSKELLREMKDDKRLNWWYVCREQSLDGDTIREFKDYVVWCYVSMFQKLSEKFIEEFTNEVDWANISTYQIISEEFIRRNKDKIDYLGLLINKKTENYSKEMQKDIFLKAIEDDRFKDDKIILFQTKSQKDIYKEHFTSYMKELYNKIEMFT